MRCPNCRCYIPRNADSCTYCGFHTNTDSMRRITLTEAYGDGFYGKPKRYRYGGGASGELIYHPTYQNNYANNKRIRDAEESDELAFQTLASLLLGMCAIFLLLLIALLVLLI